MAISKELQQKLDYYEQVYYALDKPVPFKDGLEIYPVLVNDYYTFYSSLNCLTMDKTMKIDFNEDGTPKLDPFGKPIKVTNIKGLGQSYLAFLIDMMQDKNMGQQVTLQVMQLFELIFHIKRGMYCPHCNKEVSYQEFFNGIDQYVEKALEEASELYKKYTIDKLEEEVRTIKGIENIDFKLPEDIKAKVIQNAKIDFLNKASICPECGEKLRDIFSIKTDNDNNTLMVKNIEINTNDFDELKALVPRQNILDYDGDKYIDAELKEELELKAELQNKDYTSPTLEKQLVCVGVATGYTLEYLRTITMRKLSMMLRLIDKKETYYAQIQGAMSGMVSFKAGQEPKHWIFSDDKKNIKDELTDLKDFEKKFDMVT